MSLFGRFTFPPFFGIHEYMKVYTGCLTTDMNKVSTFFMEIAPFIENFAHFLFTTDEVL